MRKFVFIGIFCCMVGCALDTRPIVVEKPTASSRQSVQSQAKKLRETLCHGAVVDLIDARETTSLGLIGFKEFQFNEFWKLLNEGLQRGLSTPTDPQPDKNLQVKILKAYFESNRTTLSFNFVTQVGNAAEPSQNRTYRVQTTKVLWGGGDRELVNYIHQAITLLAEKIAIGEQLACPANDKK